MSCWTCSMSLRILCRSCLEFSSSCSTSPSPLELQENPEICVARTSSQVSRSVTRDWRCRVARLTESPTSPGGPSPLPVGLGNFLAETEWSSSFLQRTRSPGTEVAEDGRGEPVGDCPGETRGTS